MGKDSNIPRIEKFLGKQLEHYVDYSLKNLLSAIGVTISFMNIANETVSLGGDVFDVPVIILRAVGAYGAVSYRKIYPRFHYDYSDIFKLDKIDDAYVRFSVTPDGKWFYTPCYVGIIHGKNTIDIDGIRLDWDIKSGIWYGGKEKRKELSFAITTSSLDTYSKCVEEYLIIWLNEGVSHSDFDFPYR